VPTVDRVQVGVDEGGTLHILSGGHVKSGSWTGAGVAGSCTGTIIVDAGGTLSTGTIRPFDGHLWVGMNDGAPATGNVGIVNISGTVNVAGMIGLGTLNAVTPSGGLGFVNVLDGGVLHLGNIHGLGTSIQPGSLLDIIGTGLVTLPGDFVTVAQNYIDAGRINGIVVPIFDEGSGLVIQTNIVAIPEPITISLLGLGALALLRKRS
jgi:hypothetical protein